MDFINVKPVRIHTDIGDGLFLCKLTGRTVELIHGFNSWFVQDGDTPSRGNWCPECGHMG